MVKMIDAKMASSWLHGNKLSMQSSCGNWNKKGTGEKPKWGIKPASENSDRRDTDHVSGSVADYSQKNHRNMADDQLQMEVDWCVARLEEKLAGMDPYSRPAQEAAKVHRILKSSKAPVIKKRQAMRNTFGDYRAKMKAMEKKSLAAMKKSKLVAVTEPPSQSKFIRRSTGAQATHEASEKTVSSAADDLNQLSVSKSESQADSHVTCATDSETTVTKPPADVSASEGDFRFNFDSSECGPDNDDVKAAVASSSNSGDAVHRNYFVIKPSTEEFRFSFTLDNDDNM